MPSGDDKDLIQLKITYIVKIKRWRIDEPKASDWSLAVYDQVMEDWVNLHYCKRPGEEYYIDSIEEI